MKKNINLYIIFIISLLIVSFYYYNFINLEKEKQKESKKQLIFENNIKCMTALKTSAFSITYKIKYSEQFNSCILRIRGSIQDIFSQEILFKYDSDKEARIKFVNIK